MLLLDSINYNPSLGYMLTFLLATAGGVSCCTPATGQLEIHSDYVEPVFDPPAQHSTPVDSPSPTRRG